MAFTTRFRRLAEKVGSVVIVTIVTALTGGLVTMIRTSINRELTHARSFALRRAR